jgi:hypothetical protein
VRSLAESVLPGGAEALRGQWHRSELAGPQDGATLAASAFGPLVTPSYLNVDDSAADLGLLFLGMRMGVPPGWPGASAAPDLWGLSLLGAGGALVAVVSLDPPMQRGARYLDVSLMAAGPI